MPGKSVESGSTRIPFETRFSHFTIPEPNSGCLIWLGAVSKKTGYGVLSTGYKSEGTKRSSYAHRVSYEYFVGPIPDGLDLDHKCRVRCCVNPDHLEPVTRADNILRGILPALMSARAKEQTHCKRGHPLSGDNLYENNGRRSCRACKKMWDNFYRNRDANNC